MRRLLNDLMGLPARMQAQRQAKERWAGGIRSDGGIRVFYGRDHVPGRGEVAQGGIVKCQDLQERFPNTLQGANLVYLVSSALPIAAGALVRRAREAGARIVLNQNGVAYQAWFGPGWQRQNTETQDILRQVDYVMYQSRFCKMSADRHVGPCACPWEVLHNPVDTQHFTPAAKNRPATSLTLLAAGSHVQAYRVTCALQAFRHVHVQIPDAVFVLAGHFGWRSNEEQAEREVRDQCRQLGIQDRVQIRRRYTQKEALALFQGAHVLLHTKYNDPCPRIVVEAMACGLPVVFSATGGVPELVGDEAGVGIPGPLDWDTLHPPDPQQLAEGVIGVWRDYARYTAAARRRAVEHFDLQPWLNRHAELFRQLIS